MSDGLHRAASRVLHGDDSIAAAQALEAALLEEYTDDERVSELLESVARYGHSGTDPYFDGPEVRRLLMDTLEQLGRRVTRVELSRRPQCWAFTVFEDLDERASGELACHTRDLAAAREALVSELRREFPRVLSLRWSATGNGVWVGQLPGHH